MKSKPSPKINPVRKSLSNGVKVRRFWTINPKTRVKESFKIYYRHRKKRETKKLIEES